MFFLKKMNNSYVYIICGVHNNLPFTKRLISCLEKQTYKRFKIIIIDDGSSDGTSTYIKENHKNVKLIKSDGNLWWTGAMYEGIKYILKYAKQNDYVLTINNDCTVEPNFITVLVENAQNYPKTIVGSLIIDADNKSKIIDAGVKINWETGKFLRVGPKNVNEIDNNKINEENIDTISTRGTLFPIEVFHKVGNFDKKHLPHYISDYEFACRAKRKGYNLVLSYKARVYNVSSNTGIGDEIPKKITYKELQMYLFGRRSRVNVIDSFWFIKLCCPMKYKLKNYLLIGLKILYLISLTYPLNMLKKPTNQYE